LYNSDNNKTRGPRPAVEITKKKKKQGTGECRDQNNLRGRDRRGDGVKRSKLGSEARGKTKDAKRLKLKRRSTGTSNHPTNAKKKKPLGGDGKEARQGGKDTAGHGKWKSPVSPGGDLKCHRQDTIRRGVATRKFRNT